jgi:hypothetical protein
VANEGSPLLEVIESKQEKPTENKKILIAGIPEHITGNKLLSEAIAILPPHYNF